MPLTTYTAGEVLTATSLNDNFTFAANNPPATPSGLEFITGAAFTTATSFSLPDATFSATYQNYKIVIYLTAAATDPTTLTMRMRVGGADTTTGNYNTMLVGLTNGGAGANLTGNSQTSFAAASTRVGRYALVADIINPFATGYTHFAVSIGTRESTASVGRAGVYIFDDTTSFDSLSFIGSAASSLTGNYKVYGYANS